MVVGVVDKVSVAGEADGRNRQPGNGPRNLNLRYAIRLAFPLVVRRIIKRGDRDIVARVSGVGADDVI